MEIYKGIGTSRCEHEELIDFLNYVFSMNGATRDFERLLPKHYRPQYHPEQYNYIITEDGRLRGAVGAYPIELQVMGKRLHGMGVGNVAVHPKHRGKGYMKECMNMAMQGIIESGADFAVLGGERQRYSYFGFEPSGVFGKFRVNGHNLRHGMGNEGQGYTVKRLSAQDVQELSCIREISERQLSCAVRAQDRLFDVLSSWESKICAVFSPASEMVGYYLERREIVEIDCILPEHARGVLRACFEHTGSDSLTLFVPEYAQTMYDLLIGLAGGHELANTELCNVLHYENVVSACIKLKAQIAPLADGEITMEINGYAAREALRIQVIGGCPRVTATENPCEMSLTHKQAMNLLFALQAPLRRTLPAFAAAWFPLPLFVPECDND